MAPRARAAVLMCGGRPGVLAALTAVAVMRAREVTPRMRWSNWTQVGFSVTFRSAGLKLSRSSGIQRSANLGKLL